MLQINDFLMSLVIYISNNIFFIISFYPNNLYTYNTLLYITKLAN